MIGMIAATLKAPPEGGSVERSTKVEDGGKKVETHGSGEGNRVENSSGGGGEVRKENLKNWGEVIFAATMSLVLTAGLAGFFYAAQGLTKEILSLSFAVNSQQLRLVGYLLLSQGVIVSSAGLLALFVRKWVMRLVGILVATLAAVAVTNNWVVPVYWAGIIPLALIAFTGQIDKSLRVFRKFNLNRVVFYHSRTIYLVFSLFVAISIYIYTEQKPELIQQSVNQYVNSAVKSMVGSRIDALSKQIMGGDEDNNELDINMNSSDLLSGLNLPVQLNQLIPQEVFEDLLKGYQLEENLQLQEELKKELEQEVVAQTQGLISPYLNFLPYIFTIIAFLTLFEVMLLLNFVYLGACWLVLKLLLLIGMAELKEEMQPVEVLRLRG
jgi:hypothetical protein